MDPEGVGSWEFVSRVPSGVVLPVRKPRVKQCHLGIPVDWSWYKVNTCTSESLPYIKRTLVCRQLHTPVKSWYSGDRLKSQGPEDGCPHHLPLFVSHRSVEGCVLVSSPVMVPPDLPYLVPRTVDRSTV